MGVKEYLQQIWMLNVKIDNKTEELTRLKAMAAKVTSAMSGEVVSGTKNHDKLTDCIAKIMELQEELNRDIDKYVDLKREAEAVISKLETPTHYQVLHSRYVLHKTWAEIANDMGITHQWANELHRLALNHLERILKKEKVCYLIEVAT